MDLPTLLTEEEIEALKAKHPFELHRLHTRLKEGEVEAFIRRPSPQLYRKFRTESLNERKRADAIEELMRDVIVHPTRVEFSKMLDYWPALCEEMGDQMLEIIGLVNKSRSEKL